MKTLKGILPAIFSLLLLLPVISAACNIVIKIDKNNIKPGDLVTITVTSIKEHRNCSLSDDDYSFELSNNATLLEEHKWVEKNRGVFTNDYKIRVNKPGLFTFRVYRECNKKGISEGKFSYQVN